MELTYKTIENYSDAMTDFSICNQNKLWSNKDAIKKSFEALYEIINIIYEMGDYYKELKGCIKTRSKVTFLVSYVIC